MKKRCDVWKKKWREKWKGANAFDDVEGVCYVQEKGALIMVIGVLVDEEDVMGASSARAWEQRRCGAKLFRWYGEEMSEVYAGQENTCGIVKAARAALQMALDVSISSGKERTV